MRRRLFLSSVSDTRVAPDHPDPEPVTNVLPTEGSVPVETREVPACCPDRRVGGCVGAAPRSLRWLEPRVLTPRLRWLEPRALDAVGTRP